MLKTAIIVEDHSKADEVGLNNTVEIYCEDDDEVETYRIVTSVRGSSLNGLVSIESPIGKALLGHKEGDRVYVKVNDDTGISRDPQSDQDRERRRGSDQELLSKKMHFKAHH